MAPLETEILERYDFPPVPSVKKEEERKKKT